MRKQLDRFDVKLLSRLQEDNQLTAEMLAGPVGLSPSAVSRRVRQLRQGGFISADNAIVSEQALGSSLFAIVQVQLERHALNEVDALRRQLKACENVQFCLEISGAFDIMLLMVAADMEAFNRIVDVLLGDHRAVRRYETSFVKKRLKATLALPLDQFI